MINANAKIPALQAQMQWVAGSPQTSTTSVTRMMYNFNNANNTLDLDTGFLPGIIETSTAQQESTICDPQTGEWVLFFDGNNIYDGLGNLVNPNNKLDTITSTSMTSIIAPSLSSSIPTYNVFYVDKTTHHLNYGIVNFPAGMSNEANWVGMQSLSIDNGVATPFGLACRNQKEYWVLTLANVNTLVAYKCDVTGVNTTAPVHIMLQPFASLTGTVDCTKSSIVTFGDKIAITVNNNIMVGTFNFNTGFSIPQISQSLVAMSTITLAPDFNASGTHLYYLKTRDSSNKNHVWVYEMNSGASYSADSSYAYTNQYKTLKLAPNGIIYGINLFTTTTHADPILNITEIPESGTISVTETIIQNLNSSNTFGNIQYQINNF
ncbi:MAG TPA: hypothetical protein VH187_23045 [Scandinavium sp.]|jgi:hypothetical protein|uniref:hypothetical protein n=1 Tax=Scandinavium sp. TaxID=2830653 RepID=UPI002E330C9F|nr:hypothetical protein [Scandinavium sp.]HEX4504006.1 hypothetical protein [Scandinavium sp.]